MNAQRHHESWEDPVDIGVDVITGKLGDHAGYLITDERLIVLDENLTGPERRFGEAHLRAHSSLGDSFNAHNQADLLAAIQLVPFTALRAALRGNETAESAADDLGVTVQALWVRLDGIRADDRILAEELACEVEWPTAESVTTFACTVVNVAAELARRNPLKMVA